MQTIRITTKTGMILEVDVESVICLKENDKVAKIELREDK